MSMSSSGDSTIRHQTPWQIQRAVVFGAFIRELENRFGRYALGYLWAPLEPLLYIFVVSLVRGRFADGLIAGISPVAFFAAGVLPYILFRNMANTCLSCVESNLGLFIYQRVKPADIFVARFILEHLIILSVALVIFPVIYQMGQTFTLNDGLYLFWVLFLFSSFLAGIGLLATVIGPLWVEAKKVFPLLLRPFFFISGLFFPLSTVPTAARPFLTWNPLLHAFELIRYAAFEGYQLAPEISLTYLTWCALVTLALGLSIYRLHRIKIITSGTIR